jgi:hypothetical protein
VNSRLPLDEKIVSLAGRGMRRCRAPDFENPTNTRFLGELRYLGRYCTPVGHDDVRVDHLSSPLHHLARRVFVVYF